MPLDYEARYREAYRDNVRNVLRDLRNGRLEKKINNFCHLHGFESEDVIGQIKDNGIVAACFAVNPNRQNIYEKIAADFIKNIDGVNDFKALSSNDLIVVSGGVLPKREFKGAGGQAAAKTIDFKWRYGTLTFYASHKYTKESGGSQDNQYKDLQAFLKECIQTNSPDNHFVAVADGPYYQNRNGQAGVSRINRLKQLASNDKAHACTVCELEGLMKKIVAKERCAIIEGRPW